MTEWLNKTWEKEDIEFALKRKVNNKQSRYIHHNSGYLYSLKMKRHVGYESLWGECLFYYYLELDPLTIRYYEQPIKVPISVLDQNYELTSWSHVPDVLVFRQGNIPNLFQIKGGERTQDEENRLVNKFCEKYARKRNWRYSVIYPKEISPIIVSNISFLRNYMKPRKHFEDWIPEILNKMRYKHEIKVIELAKGFSAKIDFRYVLPVIYHLIASGYLATDIFSKINEQNVVRLGSISEQISALYDKGENVNEAL